MNRGNLTDEEMALEQLFRDRFREVLTRHVPVSWSWKKSVLAVDLAREATKILRERKAQEDR